MSNAQKLATIHHVARQERRVTNVASKALGVHLAAHDVHNFLLCRRLLAQIAHLTTLSLAILANCTSQISP